MLGGVAQSLLLIQMVVRYPLKEGVDRKAFCVSVLVLTFFFCSLVVVFSILLEIIFPEKWNLEGISISLAAATGAYIVKEFFIRYSFIQERTKHHSIYINGSLIVVLMTGVFFLRDSIDVKSGIILYGIGHFTAACIGYVVCDLKLADLSRSKVWSSFLEVYPNGSWAAFSSIVYSIRANAHTLIVASLLGSVGVAAMNSARTVVTPATLLIPALSNIALPRFSRILAHEGKSAMSAYAMRVVGVVSLVCLAYSILLIACWPLIDDFVLGGKYPNSMTLGALWCLYALVLAFRSGIEWCAMALQIFRKLFSIYVIGALITILLVATLTGLFSVLGAIVGVIFGEILVVIMMLYLVKISFRRK